MEILINTPHISELILKGELGEIKIAMQEILYQDKDIKATLDKAKAEVDRSLRD